MTSNNPSKKLIRFAISALALAGVLMGCNASSDNNVTGAGGSSSTGGSTATGGTTSTGGTTATGGTTSTGGTTGTGGVASTGGTTGAGGVTGTGGTIGTGRRVGRRRPRDGQRRQRRQRPLGGGGHPGGGTSGGAKQRLGGELRRRAHADQQRSGGQREVRLQVHLPGEPGPVRKVGGRPRKRHQPRSRMGQRSGRNDVVRHHVPRHDADQRRHGSSTATTGRSGTSRPA